MPDSCVIDVLVPAFNAERTLSVALNSIQHQSVENINIIVLNDGSTDDTLRIAQDHASRDSRIFIIDRPNQGIVTARNCLIKASTSPYIAMHDADDISYYDRLERQLSYLKQNPDCVAVSGNGWHINDNGDKAGGHSTFSGDTRSDPWSLPSVEPYLPQTFVMMRRNAVLSIGGYIERTNAEDTDLYWRLLSVGKLHNLADIIGEIRMGTTSASSAAASSGRISAISSQVAAISRQRHLMAAPALDIPHAVYSGLRSLRTMNDMISCLSPYLAQSEQTYLRQASAAKLLELASYRPYLLTIEDCRAIKASMGAIRASKTGRERLRLVYQQAHVLRKLLANWRWQEAKALGASPLVYAGLLPAAYGRKVRSLLQDFRKRAGDRARG